MSDEDIELAVDWDGEDGAFVAALREVGFVDGDERRSSIHDWEEHNPWAAGSEARSEKARWAALCKQHGRKEAARIMPEYAKRIGAVTDEEADSSKALATGKPTALPESASSTPTAESSTAPSPSPSPYPSPSPKDKTSRAILPDSTPAKASTEDDPSPEFLEAWRAYPAREGGNPRKAAWKAWKARIREGVDAQDLCAGVRRYAAYLQARGEVGTRFVMQASTFFGPDEHWCEPYGAGDSTIESSPDPAWWLVAGFSARWEAENEGCTEGKAWMFEGGKQVRQPQDWQAYKAGRAGEGQP